MTTISISEIQRDLSGYLRRVQAGETFVITDRHRPVAEIKPITPPSNGQRPFGLAAGEFEVPEDFDDPLPDDILREFGSL
ncbi:MAG: type II toxin-antitoxin system prevent-host-death family antitoxin [Planctomycetes bacterium]|nr:type II toxin-antitoxin system prevent-host-death family antitoxin [Planctomycetota bacterium]